MAEQLLHCGTEILLSSRSDDWFPGAPPMHAAGGYQVATAPLVDWKLPTASPSVPTTALPMSSRSLPSYDAPSEPVAVPDEPKDEWAAEAIVNLRHVVVGIVFALVIEGAVALCIFATWNLWHIR
jgi:hypothetical protein